MQLQGRIAAVLALLVCAAVGAAAQDPVLKHLSTVYRYQDDTTVFTYELTSGKYSVGHWVLNPRCTKPGKLAPNQPWQDLTDPAGPKDTHAPFWNGLKYPLGQPAGTTVVRIYQLIFRGEVKIDLNQDYEVYSNGKPVYGKTVGPTCSGVLTAKVPCEIPCDYTAECGNLTTPGFAGRRLVERGAVVPPTVELVSNITVPGSCPNEETIIRLYRTNTGSNAYSECVQTIKIRDTLPPKFDEEIPRFIFISCNDTIPPPLNLTAYDLCDGNITDVTVCEERTNGTCPAEFWITRTYTASDKCVNSECLVQTIISRDNDAPWLHGVPADLYLECVPNITLPEPANVTASDHGCDCYLNQSHPVQYTETRYAGDCGNNTFSVERVWTVTDCCGNVNSSQQIITVIDTTAPVLYFRNESESRNQTVECDSVPPPADVFANDTCSPYVNVTFNETRINGSCPSNYLLIRKWYAVDLCGNRAETPPQYIQVRDTRKPVLHGLPPVNQTIPCTELYVPPNVTATDNCGPTYVTVNVTIQTILPCEDKLIITTWVATDLCNNTVNFTSFVLVENTQPPVPPNDTVTPPILTCESQVDPIIDFLNTTVTPLREVANCTIYDNGTIKCPCANIADVTTKLTQGNSSCPSNVEYIFDIIYTDCRNQTTIVSVPLLVQDDTPPELIGVPPNTTVNCTEPPFPTDVIACDTCDCNCTDAASQLLCPESNRPPVLISDTRINGSCPYAYTILRNFTTYDLCGNVRTEIQNITVTPLFAPVWTPIDLVVNTTCENVTAVPNVTATSECENLTVTFYEERVNGSCLNNYDLLRTWVATDSCENTATLSQTVHVRDTTPPEIIGEFENVDANCTVPPPLDLCITDNCPNVTGRITQYVYNLTECIDGAFAIVQRVYLAVDACGNTDSASYNITLHDREPPYFLSNQSNVNTSCSNPIIPPPPQAADNCTEAHVEDYSRRVDTCGGSFIVYRSFKAVDSCGNFVWQNYTVTASDNTPPTVPPNSEIYANCTAPPAAPGASFNVSDDCSNFTVTLTAEHNVSVICPHRYTLVRTYTAVDDCNNTAQFNVTVYVNDTIAPTFVNRLPNATTDCVPPNVTYPRAVDNCGENATVTLNETVVPGRCPRLIIREFIATDLCGNTATQTQHITVDDTQPPVFTDAPANVTVTNCSIPAPPDVCVTDNCPNFTLTYRETGVPGSCPHNYTLVRVWNATDQCHNSATVQQVVTVIDVEPPVFTTPVPPNIVINCTRTLPRIIRPNVTDNCDPAPRLTPHHRRVPGTCPNVSIYYISWAATDACDNRAWFNYTITEVDRTPPTVHNISDLPRVVNDSCEPVYLDVVINATDSCSNVTIREERAFFPGSCNYTFNYSRTFYISDACNNTVSHTFNISHVHVRPPVITGPLINETIYCLPGTLPTPVLEAKDACNVTVPIHVTQTNTTLNCPANVDYLRVYSATDDCGLTTSRAQLIEVRDFAPPIVFYGFNRTLPYNCDNPIQVRPPPQVRDDCSNTTTVISNTTNFVCPYIFTITYTAVVTDECNNTADPVSVTDSYTYDLTPTLHGLPVDAVVPCDDVPDPANVTATDGCGVPLNVTFTETRVNGSCPNNYTLYRVWATEDACDLTASHTQTIKVGDNVPPTLHGVPGSITIQCGSEPCAANVTATDNCPGNVTIVFTETDVPGPSGTNFTIIRKWVATDVCNNSATATQIIHVVNFIPPVIIIPPDLGCLECPFNISTLPVPNVTAYTPNGFCVDSSLDSDNCTLAANIGRQSTIVLSFGSENLTLTVNGGSIAVLRHEAGTYEVILTLTAANGSVYTLNLDLTDVAWLYNLGNYQAQLGLKPECYGSNPRQPDPADWQYFRHINGSLFGPSGQLLGSVTNLANLFSQFGLGANTQNAQMGLAIYFSFTPTAGSPSGPLSLLLDLSLDGTQSCVFNISTFPRLACVCNETLNVTFSQNVTFPPCDPATKIVEIVERVWCVTDYWKHLVCATQTITVCDTIPPNITGLPEPITLTCLEGILPYNVSATDACDSNVTLDIVDQLTNGSCATEFISTITVTATDDCGNVAIQSTSFSRVDDQPPTISGLPNETQVVNCTDVPITPVTPIVRDDCNVTFLNITQVRINDTGAPICPQHYIIRTIYVASDACNNSVTAYYDTEVIDIIPPVISNLPPNRTINCTDPIPPVSGVQATDDCAGNVTDRLNFTVTLVPDNCGIVSYRYTWTVTDLCGNSATAIRWLTVVDNTPPVLQNTPANTTVECDAVPPVANVTASDDCSAFNLFFSNYTVPGSCVNEYDLYRIWTVYDCQGRIVSHVQVIHVRDTTPPTIIPSTIPDVNTTNCTARPGFPELCVVDNCPNVTLRYTETRTNLTDDDLCARYNLTRVFTATDACGNVNTTSYTVTVWDVSPPVCQPVAPQNVSCTEEEFSPPAPNCTDDCSGVIVTPRRTLTITENCTVIYYYEWTVADHCGNSRLVNTSIRVILDRPLYLSGVPADLVLECNETVPAANVTAVTDCPPPTGNITIVFSETRVNGTCPGVYNLTRTWQAVDQCGRASNVSSQLIQVVDTTAPYFLDHPANTSAQCTPGTPPTVRAADICGPVNITLVTTETPGNVTCERIITRTWTATDCSGNTATLVQVVRVLDTIPPTFDSTINKSIEATCKDIPPPSQLCGSDNCPNITGRINQSLVCLDPAHPCPECARFTIVRTYTLIDACGNTNVTTQNVTVYDDVAPVCQPYTIPPNVSCAELPALLANASSRPNCSDDCSAVNYTLYNFTTPGPQPCAASLEYHFNWLVSDACGNFVWVNVSVNVTETQPPVPIVPPQNITLPCNESGTAFSGGAPNATAECGNVTVTELGGSVPPGCLNNVTVARRFSLISDCGLETIVEQYITFVDIYPPTWDNATLPQNQNISCNQTYVPPHLTATDDCTNATVTVEVTRIAGRAGYCGEVFIVLYTASDDCNNTITHTYNVTRVDNTPPTLVAPPVFGGVFNCTDIPAPPSLCCIDNCPNVTGRVTRETIPNSELPTCNYTLRWQYTCIDFCGLNDTAYHEIIVVDNTPPTFTSPAPVSLDFECSVNFTIPIYNLTAEDACHNVTITRDEYTYPGGCPANYTIVHVYTAADECNNSVSVNATFNVRDTIPPFVGNNTLVCAPFDNTFNNSLHIPNVTVPNVFFAAGDLCSTINITIINCTSNQDDELGNGCTYDAATDTLLLSLVIVPTDALGRLYTVSAVVTDACGHQTLTSRVVLIPLNATSFTERNLTVIEECLPSNFSCPRECPCQFADQYCTVTNDSDASLVYENATVVNGTTRFLYRLVLGVSGIRPERIVLALDLTNYQIVDVSPDADVTFGQQDLSVLKGIAWNNADIHVSDWYSFTVNGVVTLNPNSELAYQLGGSNCSPLLTVRGPDGSLAPDYSSFDPSDRISGTVAIVGSRSGSQASHLPPPIPLNHIMVAVLDKITHQLLAFTITDTSGNYEIDNVQNQADKELVLFEDALLRPALRSSGNFLRANPYDILGVSRLGTAHPLSDPDFWLLLDDQEQPVYNRPADVVGFEGNSKPVEWWFAQYANYGEHAYDLTDAQLTAIATRASALLSCAVSFGGPELERQLLVAALNEAYGLGFFEPYRLLQRWIIQYADRVVCAGFGNAADQATALRLLKEINTAH